jgi:hypothetical protein
MKQEMINRPTPQQARESNPYKMGTGSEIA